MTGILCIATDGAALGPTAKGEKISGREKPRIICCNAQVISLYRDTVSRFSEDYRHMSKKAYKLVKTMLREMQPGDTAVVATADHASMGKSKVNDENSTDRNRTSPFAFTGNTPDPENIDRVTFRKRRDDSASLNAPFYVRIVRKGSDGGGDDLAVVAPHLPAGAPGADLLEALLFSAVRGNVGMPGLKTAPTAEKQPDRRTGEYPTDSHGMQTFDPPGSKRRYHNNCG